MNRTLLKIGAAALMLPFFGCTCHPDARADLERSLYEFVNTQPGTVGIAIVSDCDTVTVNNGVHYPMMSVFKLHQALAVCHALEEEGASIDSIICIGADELDPDTWSPMLKEHGKRDLQMPVSSLMRYAITCSDNNASNLLFSHIATPAQTDRFVKSIARDTSFAIRYSEGQMKADHSRAYANYTSPLAAAMLIGQVFDACVVDSANQEFVKAALCEVTTGHDRIGKAVADVPGVVFAHKTGSGYRNAQGELAAHNDVAYIALPDGRRYSLAVLIRDYAGTEAEASAAIARISEIAYRYVKSL